MNPRQSDTVSQKLDRLVRVAALSLVGDRTQRDDISMLSNGGFRPKEIAEILGTTASTV